MKLELPKIGDSWFYSKFRLSSMNPTKPIISLNNRINYEIGFDFIGSFFNNILTTGYQKLK